VLRLGLEGGSWGLVAVPPVGSRGRAPGQEVETFLRCLPLYLHALSVALYICAKLDRNSFLSLKKMDLSSKKQQL